jgi:hypothetical protein
MEKKKLLDLTILIPGLNFHISFVNSLTRFAQAHPEVEINLAYESSVYSVRDRLLGCDSTKGRYQKPAIKTKYFMFIDSDAIFDVEDVENLYDSIVETEHKVMTGWTCIQMDKNQYSPFFFIDEHWGTDKSFRSTGKRLTMDDVAELPDVFQVKIVGCHFTMVETAVLEKLSAPWFRPYVFDAYGTQAYAGEDSSFCLRMLQELGHGVYVNKAVQVGHLKSVDILGKH